MTDPHRRRVGLVISGVMIVAGLAGLWYARDLGLTEADGAFVVPAPDDFVWARQLQFNPLGALVTAGLGALALVGVLLARRSVTLTAAGVGVLAAAVSLVQLGRPSQVLGARGGNVALLLALAIGLVALELTPPVDEADGRRAASAERPR